MSKVVESCLETLFITIEQFADLFISNERLSEAISIDHLRVWQYNLNQESLESLTDRNLVGRSITLTVPRNVRCDTDQDFNELVSVKHLLSALFKAICTHNSLVEALHYCSFIQEVLLKDATLSSIIDEVFERKRWVLLWLSNIEQEDGVEFVEMLLQDFFDLPEHVAERALDLAERNVFVEALE